MRNGGGASLSKIRKAIPKKNSPASKSRRGGSKSVGHVTGFKPYKGRSAGGKNPKRTITQQDRSNILHNLKHGLKMGMALAQIMTATGVYQSTYAYWVRLGKEGLRLQAEEKEIEEKHQWPIEFYKTVLIGRGQYEEFIRSHVLRYATGYETEKTVTKEEFHDGAVYELKTTEKKTEFSPVLLAKLLSEAQARQRGSATETDAEEKFLTDFIRKALEEKKFAEALEAFRSKQELGKEGLLPGALYLPIRCDRLSEGDCQSGSDSLEENTVIAAQEEARGKSVQIIEELSKKVDGEQGED